MSDRFGDWLLSTRALQRDGFGADAIEMSDEDWADYVLWNYAAATVELGEFLQELPWKPWKPNRGRPDAHARERAVVELVDVLHFVGNILVALEVTDDELSEAYEAKQRENRARLADGRATTTGPRSKSEARRLAVMRACGNCGRAGKWPQGLCGECAGD